MARQKTIHNKNAPPAQATLPKAPTGIAGLDEMMSIASARFPG